MLMEYSTKKFKIDFVVLWVDGTDEKWQKKKNKYLLEQKKLNNTNRYRDMGVFEYWFKNVFRFAPWVNNVYLVTDHQTPDFIKKYPKVIVIDHEQIINRKYLPTFNSNTIELNIWKIPNLEEHFVLFNDDTYLSNFVQPADFFSATGKPRLTSILNVIQPSDEFSYIPFNNMELLNKHFSKKDFLRTSWKKVFNIAYGKRNFQSLLALPYPSITGFYEDHLPAPHLKSTFKKLATSVFKDEFEKQNKRRFRTKQDISQWLVKEFNILSNNYVVRPIKAGTLCRLQNTRDLSIIKKSLKTYKMVCINDNVISNKNWITLKEKLKEIFEKDFGELQ